MVRTPGFGAVGRTGVAFGELVDGLEHNFDGHYAFIFLEHLLAEVCLEVFADDEYDFAEAGLDGIVYRVVHDGFTVGAEAVELLQAAIAAAHAGCKNK